MIRIATPLFTAAAMVTGMSVAIVVGQRADAFIESPNHPAIDYAAGPVNDPVARLNETLRDGAVRLAFDPTSGYLRSVLGALGVPTESQVLVFSQTSLQADQISPKNPRAIFFKDDVAVGWVRGSKVLEVAAHDPRQGARFYSLVQDTSDRPQFKRHEECFTCHLSWDTLGVPGFLVLSTFPMPEDKNAYANGFVSDHRSPLQQRWGGWYVTGTPGSFRHMGNLITAAEAASRPRGPSRALKSVQGLFDTTGYLSDQSDLAALMVLEHQTHMLNLITRLGWESRLAAYGEPAASGGENARDRKVTGADRVREAAYQLVDYMLFVDEALPPSGIQGASGFAENFGAQGPRDRKGRSLRQLDLQHRLMRYPCSYLIYVDGFDALPASAKEIVYRRMWQILSGQEKKFRYARLSLADRKAVVEILRETKKDLPNYFQPVVR